MKDRRKIKGKCNLRYNLTIWKKNDAFYILNYISEDVTLVQLMESLGNLNRAISIVMNLISDSNYKKELFLTQESWDIILFTCIVEKPDVTFQPVFLL